MNTHDPHPRHIQQGRGLNQALVDQGLTTSRIQQRLMYSHLYLYLESGDFHPDWDWRCTLRPPTPPVPPSSLGTLRGSLWGPWDRGRDRVRSMTPVRVGMTVTTYLFNQAHPLQQPRFQECCQSVSPANVKPCRSSHHNMILIIFFFYECFCEYCPHSYM